MNRTELIAQRMGHNDRWSNHVCGFRKPGIAPRTQGERIPREIIEQLEEVNREANTFPPIDVFLK